MTPARVTSHLYIALTIWLPVGLAAWALLFLGLAPLFGRG